jgi:hypothetical protein
VVDGDFDRDRLSRTTPAINRLLAPCVEDENGCWVRHVARSPKGYTRLRVNGRKVAAHRFAWEFFRGEIPDGLTFDHLCKNPPCVNPWHGELVTALVNSLRSGGTGAANRVKTHCPQGHPLSGENLRYSSRGRGRVCRICRAESDKRYRERQKVAA